MARVVEQACRHGLEAFGVLGERNIEPFAVGSRLLVG
jgi:hypothetical protein